MRHPLTLLFLLLIGTLLVKQVRAPLPHPDEVPHPEPAPQPIYNDPDDNTGSSPGDGDDTGGGAAGYGPLTPLGDPPAEANEAEIKEEDNDYSDILDAISSLLDAITSIISLEIDSSSSTTVSAPLPTAARPCYSVSSIYDKCALQNSVFPNVIFPIQASCLCYTSGASDTFPIWVPSSYDGLISSCNDYAQTQTLASITAIGNSSSQFNLCSSAGDVRATPALALPSSTTTSTATPASSPTTQTAPTSTSNEIANGSPNRNSAIGSLILCIGLWIFRIVM